jgi:glycosyltransferase involved in cell wall biosynthesis
MQHLRAAYVSFDTVPAPKGAATHIEAFARTLAAALGGLELVTVALGPEPAERVERWPGVFHTELPAMGATLIDRVMCFRRFLTHWLADRKFEVIQFRSIFEGLPLLKLAGAGRLVFEVNGLPSIELKYRYPGMEDDRELMRKLLAQEQRCFEGADLIVTPSGVTQRYLISARGVRAERVRVIPNGVDTELFRPRTRTGDANSLKMIYFGTLSSWQGVDLGIRALAQIRLEIAASLTIVGTGSGRERESLMQLAAKLGVAAHIAMLPAIPQAELAECLSAADVMLAPLTLNDRNLVQGCCPLKILEGMAAGVPVIVSGLPVVRELGCDGAHFLVVKAGSVDQITQAALRLARDPALAARIAEQARAHVLANYTWERSGELLMEAYAGIGISRSRID